jgi:hypothetical protein
VQGELPQCRRPQRNEIDKDIHSKISTKLSNVREKGYISKMEVLSLTSFFAVPKGEDDIRMVYDATQSGLNAVLWAPNFQLPTADMLARSVEQNSWMGDLDVAEQFLNFCLDPALRPFCGVDLKAYFQDAAWEGWTRCMMGLKPSPYVCIKGQLLATEVVMGDRKDPINPFRWAEVVLNLPGTPKYNPGLPRVWKAQDKNGARLAAALLQYVDDLRVAGASDARGLDRCNCNGHC